MEGERGGEGKKTNRNVRAREKQKRDRERLIQLDTCMVKAEGERCTQIEIQRDRESGDCERKQWGEKEEIKQQ